MTPEMTLLHGAVALHDRMASMACKKVVPSEQLRIRNCDSTLQSICSAATASSKH